MNFYDTHRRNGSLTFGVEGGTAGNASPNSQIAAFDLSVPGTQPVIQKAALLPAIRAALALGCQVQTLSQFDRKHYFYHDQPAGYQITQYYAPLAKHGVVTLRKRDGIDPDGPESIAVGIKQIQLEQDTAKTQEHDEGRLLVDFNRAGHPLIEIITLPQIHSPTTAAAFVRKIQALLLSVDAVTTGMEDGGLRADVNVSVRPTRSIAGRHEYGGVSGLGQRTEIKNLGTIKAVELAVAAERDRQISVLEQGGNISGETRGWSLSAKTETRRLRSKEGEVDYRYMPDPDIPPLVIDPECVHQLSQNLPPLPEKLVSMLVSDPRFRLSETDAQILVHLDGGERLDFYQEVVAELSMTPLSIIGDTARLNLGQLAGNWVLQKLGKLMSIHGVPWSENRVDSSSMAAIVVCLVRRKITGKTAQRLLDMKFGGDGRHVEQIIRDESLEFVPLSEDEYSSLASLVTSEHPKVVEQVRQSPKNKGKIMFLVGQLIRRGGADKVEAQMAERILRETIFKSV